MGTNLLISSFCPWRMHSAIQTRFLREGGREGGRGGKLVVFV